MSNRIPEATQENLQEAFADTIRHDDRVTLDGLAEAFQKAMRTHTELAADEAMQLANNRLMGYGVETINGGEDREAVAYYVNMGDPYVYTVIYDIPANKFYVTGYVDWVEWRENNRKYKLS